MVNKFILIIIFVTTIALSVVGLCSQSYIIVITNQWECKWATDSFVLQWRHSVEKQLWQDYYQRNNQQFKLTHSFVQSFGAGVPSEGKAIPAPQGFVGIQHDLILSEVNWTVSRRMQGEMIEPKQRYYFKINQYVDDYASVNIQVQQQANIIWWWRSIMSHQSYCHDMFTS